MVKHITGESELHLGRAFEAFIAILASFKFDSNVIYSDADPAVVAQLNGHGKVRVEVCAAGVTLMKLKRELQLLKNVLEVSRLVWILLCSNSLSLS